MTSRPSASATTDDGPILLNIPLRNVQEQKSTASTGTRICNTRIEVPSLLKLRWMALESGQEAKNRYTLDVTLSFIYSLPPFPETILGLIKNAEGAN